MSTCSCGCHREITNALCMSCICAFEIDSSKEAAKYLLEIEMQQKKREKFDKREKKR